MVWWFKRRAPDSAEATEPPEKKARTQTGSPQAELSQKLLEAQLQLHDLDEECAEKQIAVQLEYDKKREEWFQKRSNELKNVDSFWACAILGHPARLFTQEEVPVLKKLTNVEVKENLDKKGSFEIKLEFSENPWFSNRQIKKRVTFLDATNDRVEPAKLDCISEAGKALVASLQNKTRSVLGWMLMDKSISAAGPMQDFGDVLRRDLWQDPMPHYNAYNQAQKMMASVAPAAAPAEAGPASPGSSAMSATASTASTTASTTAAS